MIYEYPTSDMPIRQGDIFVGLPRIDVPLDRIPVIDDDGVADWSWLALAKRAIPVEAILPIRPVIAIVISQDCDAIRAPDVSLCEIRPFAQVDRKAEQTKDPKGWVSILTQHARLNLKWFYLPPDGPIGFAEKMAVNFTVTLRVGRTDLEQVRGLRKGRLNPTADEHFRERLAEYFRRYPYDEWYALDADELKEYRRRHGEVPAFPWQQPG